MSTLLTNIFHFVIFPPLLYGGKVVKGLWEDKFCDSEEGNKSRCGRFLREAVLSRHYD